MNFQTKPRVTELIIIKIENGQITSGVTSAIDLCRMTSRFTKEIENTLVVLNATADCAYISV